MAAADEYSKVLDSHIDELVGLVFRQHELIHRLGSSGQSTISAEQFLAVLNDALATARARRAAGQPKLTG